MRAVFAILAISAGSAEAATYAVMDNGVVVNCVQWDGTSGWTPPSGKFAVLSPGCVPPIVVAPPAPTPTNLAPLAFLLRFTPAERTSIRALPALADWLDLVRAAVEIDVTNQQTIAGMQALVQYGVISADRSAWILDLSRASP